MEDFHGRRSLLSARKAEVVNLSADQVGLISIACEMIGVGQIYWDDPYEPDTTVVTCLEFGTKRVMQFSRSRYLLLALNIPI